MPVAEMLEKMSSKELAEWMAFYEQEPWGTEVDLYGHAMTTSTLVNIYRKEDTKPVSPGDVMPSFKKPTPDDMISQAKTITDMMKRVNDVDDN